MENFINQTKDEFDNKFYEHDQKAIQIFIESKLRLLATTISEECERGKDVGDDPRNFVPPPLKYMYTKGFNDALHGIQDFISKL